MTTQEERDREAASERERQSRDVDTRDVPGPTASMAEPRSEEDTAPDFTRPPSAVVTTSAGIRHNVMDPNIVQTPPPIPTPDDPDMRINDARIQGERDALREAGISGAPKQSLTGDQPAVEVDRPDALDQAYDEGYERAQARLRGEATTPTVTGNEAAGATTVQTSTQGRETTAVEMREQINRIDNLGDLDQAEQTENARPGGARKTVTDAIEARRTALQSSESSKPGETPQT